MKCKSLIRFQQGSVLLLLGLASCGPGRGDLEGKVSLEGKALTSGDVQVFGGDGEIRQGKINPDGTYSIKDIGVGGELKFAVVSLDPNTSRPKLRAIGPGKAKLPDDTRDPAKWFPIPEEYSDLQKSGLTFGLKPGKNTWDIALKAKADPASDP